MFKCTTVDYTYYLSDASSPGTVVTFFELYTKRKHLTMKIGCNKTVLQKLPT